MQRKIVRRALDGVLLLDKSMGMTSNAALQSARRLLNAAKAGHTGTLDPMATGLLPLTFGEATKFSQMLLEADKCYEAVVRLGIETDTGDAEGATIATAPVDFDAAAVEVVLRHFIGEIEQVPPMYSALKRNGKPLYEYARAGIEVEREPRRVRIRALELLGVETDRFSIRVECSKGTYIRTLAIDLGRALGPGAHLAALRRTGIGPFGIENALTLEEIEAATIDERAERLLPVDTLVAHLPRLSLDAVQTGAILHGQVIQRDGQPTGLSRLYGPDRFLGLGEFGDDGRLAPKRLVATAS